MKRFLILWCFIFFISGCSGTVPSNIGPMDGRLSDCPKSPNCISSGANDKKHFIAPLQYSDSFSQAYSRLIFAVKSISGSQIIVKEENYIHAGFTSRVFRFVDDAEFLFDEKEKKIHIRSASRKGYSDLGVNRKRMEKIRRIFASQ